MKKKTSWREESLTTIFLALVCAVIMMIVMNEFITIFISFANYEYKIVLKEYHYKNKESSQTILYI